MDWTVSSHVEVAGPKQLDGRKGRTYSSRNLEYALAKALQSMDVLTCLAVEEGPLLVEAIQIRYEFSPGVPRRALHLAWERAIALLSQVLIVDGEGDLDLIV